jgi:hypothetical protein
MSSSSNDFDVPPFYATEMRHMLDENLIIEQCAFGFHDDPAGSALVHSMIFVSQTIQRLERELSLQHEEFDDLFNFANDIPRFRQTMRPIVRGSRRRRALSPYARTTTSPSLQSDHTSPESSSSSSPSDPPQTIDIHSHNSQESSTSSYGTANDEPRGNSRNNPIDVDASTPLTPSTDTVPRAGPSRLRLRQAQPGRNIPIPCPRCSRTGHTLSECIFTGPHRCDHCNRSGHIRRNCPLRLIEEIRHHPSIQYCRICRTTGHTTDRCSRT